MATVSQAGLFTLQSFTSLGTLGAGMRLYFYAQGTTTKKDVYTDAAGTVLHTLTSDGIGGEYLALDARGEAPAPIYMTTGAYDVTLKTSAGATVWTRRADPVGANLASSDGSSSIGFLQFGAGAVATTVQAKLREVVSVKDFGATGDGVTDDTAAIQAAAASLTGNQTLYFPDGTYLVSYIWTAKTDSDGTNGIGRGRGVCYFNSIPNIRLYGPRATIKCVDHDISAKGGFAFAWVTKSPGFTIEGFSFDMTFTGYNTVAAYYPLCGGVVCYDKYAGSGTQTTLCSDFTARDLTFKLYHPNGAFGITADPYGSDYNNGFKIVSVFASGDSAATAYAEQSRKLLMQNIRFLSGHNGYGCWGVAYNKAVFRDVHADAWVAASYTIAGGTYTGVYYVAPVRFYQYYCDGLIIDGVHVRSLEWASRTGAFQGRCGGVSVDSGLIDQYGGGGSITNCTFILDDDNAALGAAFDVGIASSLSGPVIISENSFKAHGTKGVVCMYLIGADGAGATDYVIDGNTASKDIGGPFVQVVNVNSTSDATRTIKSLTVTDNIVKGWGADGAIYSYTSGGTYYGVPQVTIANNILDATDCTATDGAGVNMSGRTSADVLSITDNLIKAATAPISTGSASLIVRDNRYSGNSTNGTFGNYLTNALPVLATFTATQAVTITAAAGTYYEYHYIEYDGSGNVVTVLADVANDGTGTIRTVGAGNTGKIVYKLIANIK